VLQNGGYLLPVHHETGHDIELVGPDTTSFFLGCRAEKKERPSSRRIRSDQGNLQPTGFKSMTGI